MIKMLLTKSKLCVHLAQHSTAQHSTAQHSTAQHSTALTNFLPFSDKLQNFSDKLLNIGINSRYVEGQLLRGGLFAYKFSKKFFSIRRDFIS